MSRALLSPQPTVLVVDDEMPLRHYMARVMADEGYRVLTAANGSDALALLEQSDSKVDLVITDVSMPFMTGPELAARLAARVLPPPVLFVSGGHSMADVPGPILQKPFLPSDLSGLVRSLISGRAEVLGSLTVG